MKMKKTAVHKNIPYSSAKQVTAIDLFCGCGAMSEGFKRAGFKIAAAVDNNETACNTYRKNHPDVLVKEADITTIGPDSLIDLTCCNVDVMIVCAPCQPFSSQNRHRAKDKRSVLIFEAVRFAERLNPSLVVFENVSGLVTEFGLPILNKLQSGLTSLGYVLGDPQTVDAADYLVPQRRKRCIMFASKIGILPKLFPTVCYKNKHKMVKDAISDLKPLKSGQIVSNDVLHFARNHSSVALSRMKHIPKNGGSRFSLPPELELACHKGKKNDFPDVYGRMRWDDVAPTLTTGCTDITRGRFMHPRDDRAITLREAARLQTFPDHYQFAGSSSDIAMQIGNAVPVLLAEAIAHAALTALQKKQKE